MADKDATVYELFRLVCCIRELFVTTPLSDLLQVLLANFHKISKFLVWLPVASSQDSCSAVPFVPESAMVDFSKECIALFASHFFTNKDTCSLLIVSLHPPSESLKPFVVWQQQDQLQKVFFVYPSSVWLNHSVLAKQADQSICCCSLSLRTCMISYATSILTKGS